MFSNLRGTASNYNTMFQSRSANNQNTSARGARVGLCGKPVAGSSDFRAWGRVREGSPEEESLRSVLRIRSWPDGLRKIRNCREPKTTEDGMAEACNHVYGSMSTRLGK